MSAPCMCPVCRINRALKTIDRAHDDWLDRDTEMEMALYHLRDEVAWVLDEPWWRYPWRQRARLREAYRASSHRRKATRHQDGAA